MNPHSTFVVQIVAEWPHNIDSSPEVYAAREKVGVYIPKDRYQMEENERKVPFDTISRIYLNPK